MKTVFEQLNKEIERKKERSKIYGTKECNKENY